MRVLVGFESSAVVRDAFRAAGHDAWSCDLLPCEGDEKYHLQMDIFYALEIAQWDLVILHPPCTYVCRSGIHWNKRRPDRAVKTEESLDLFRKLEACGIKRIAIENPIGVISTRIRKPDQIIQPYHFGHDAAKATCLWLTGLPKLEIPDEYLWFPPRLVGSKKTGREMKRWGNQSDDGNNRLGPSEDRWKERSRTYTGVAEAMARAWG